MISNPVRIKGFGFIMKRQTTSPGYGSNRTSGPTSQGEAQGIHGSHVTDWTQATALTDKKYLSSDPLTRKEHPRPLKVQIQEGNQFILLDSGYWASR